MMSAQLRLAKTGHAFALIFARISGARSWVGRVGIGMVGEGVETETRARASMTRAKTKITIFAGCEWSGGYRRRGEGGVGLCSTCLFTLPCLPLPKTA